MGKLFIPSFLLLTFVFFKQVNAIELELVAKLSGDTPVGNIAVGPDGRIFLSVHGFYGQPIKLVELLKDGSTKPYPTKKWAYQPNNSDEGLYDVLGLNVDQNGVLWLLDGSTEERSGRIIGWDTKKEKLERIIYLGRPVITNNSFLNDLAIDLKNNAIYVADAGAASIIVVDLVTGQTRKVLAGTDVTKANDIDMIVDGKVVMLGGKPARVGINPITIDPDNHYLYFGAMSGTSMYRVKTADLVNTAINDEELEKRVTRYGDKPISDGSTIDGGGNVYITSVTDDSIGVIKTDGTYEKLFQRDDLSWPDGFSYGPDHKIYVTVNELHRSPVLNNGKNEAKGEFKVLRFDALVKGAQGR